MEDQLRYGPSLIESLWRHRVVVVGVTLLMGVLGYAIGLQEPEQYEATATLFLTDPNIGGESTGLGPDFVAVDDYVPQQAARIRSRAVLTGAVEQASQDVSVGDLADSLSVEASPDTLAISITVVSPTADAAADLANAVAQAYRVHRITVENDRVNTAVSELEGTVQQLTEERDNLQNQFEADQDNQALQARIQSLDSLILDSQARIDEARLSVRMRGDGVETFEEAEPPGSPTRPRPRVTAISFAFLGAIAAASWAYWYAYRSQRVLSRTDPERVLGAPPLGEIPLYRMSSSDPLTGLLRVDPAAAEAYEFVLSSIEFALADIAGKSLLVTSTLPGDGKTTTTLQLAIAASRDRRRVVLVDADIRARGLSSVLGADDRTGLSDLAALDLGPSEVLRRYKFSEVSQIPVVTAGKRRGDPAALLRTHAFRKAMGDISDSAELLIVDSSPLLAVADAMIVADSVDGIVLVVSHGTPVKELEKVKERLKFVATPLLGYVYNRSDSSTAAAYGYGYGVATDIDGTPRLLPSGRRGRGRGAAGTLPERSEDSASASASGHGVADADDSDGSAA